MWYLACCDDDGRCFGFLTKDKTVEKNPDNNMDKLMSFKYKKDTTNTVLQINLGHALLPNGCGYRVTPVKG